MTVNTMYATLIVIGLVLFVIVLIYDHFHKKMKHHSQ